MLFITNRLTFKKWLLLIFLMAVQYPLLAQSTNAPATDDYYYLLDRYEIKSGTFSNRFYSSFKPYQRKSIAGFVAKQLDSLENLSKADQFNLQFLANDNWEWTEAADVDNKPILKFFYKKKPDLFSVHTPDFDLHVKPVIHFEAGVEADEPTPYINTRGVELRGTINKKVSFYSFLAENQARFPAYVREHVGSRLIVPGEGFWKRFKEDGVDFFSARAYIGFNATKNINIQFGHDRFFIGNGERSLILSDFGNSYPFLKIQTQVWRFSYTNLFAQLRGNIPATIGGGAIANVDYPKKFFALHHLSLNITDNLNIGLFEAIVSGDSTGNNFEFDYLNPVIFYRAIEQYGGSTDNAIVGLDLKWNFLKHFQFYGQFVLDEFLLEAYRQGNGWWGNKWALQLGSKYVDVFGVPNLDVQAEWNRVRPFMYTHQSQYTNYTHYSQPLAHPLGANFDEKLITIRYQFLKRLFLQGQYLHATYGADSLNSNFGGNIFLSYNTRVSDEGNKIGQGVTSSLDMARFTASYMLAHRLFIDLTQTVRRFDSALDKLDRNSSITSVGVRWNIGRRNYYF